MGLVSCACYVYRQNKSLLYDTRRVKLGKLLYPFIPWFLVQGQQEQIKLKKFVKTYHPSSAYFYRSTPCGTDMIHLPTVLF